jgi:hypothetical protein
MTKPDHHKPISFVGLYFIDEEGNETGQIIAEISDGYYLAQFDCVEGMRRRPDWKCYPRSISTKSATVVVSDIGDSLPMSKVD